MTVEFRVGDVRDRLAELPDGSVDLIVTSPPFLALRSYLPADHPDKDREIGSEPSPADFIDTLLGLSAEWDRVLTPTGSLCVELGDTYAGGSAIGTDWQGNDRYKSGRGGLGVHSVPDKSQGRCTRRQIPARHQLRHRRNESGRQMVRPGRRPHRTDAPGRHAHAR